MSGMGSDPPGKKQIFFFNEPFPKFVLLIPFTVKTAAHWHGALIVTYGLRYYSVDRLLLAGDAKVRQDSVFSPYINITRAFESPQIGDLHSEIARPLIQK